MRTFQHNKPFNSLSVTDNVMVGMHTRMRSKLWQIVAGTEKEGTGNAIDLSITNGLLPTNFYRTGYVP